MDRNLPFTDTSYWRQEDNMHCYQEQWEIVPCTKLMLYYSVLANDTY